MARKIIVLKYYIILDCKAMFVSATKIKKALRHDDATLQTIELQNKRILDFLFFIRIRALK